MRWHCFVPPHCHRRNDGGYGWVLTQAKSKPNGERKQQQHCFSYSAPSSSHIQQDKNLGSIVLISLLCLYPFYGQVYSHIPVQTELWCPYNIYFCIVCARYLHQQSTAPVNYKRKSCRLRLPVRRACASLLYHVLSKRLHGSVDVGRGSCCCIFSTLNVAFLDHKSSFPIFYDLYAS